MFIELYRFSRFYGFYRLSGLLYRFYRIHRLYRYYKFNDLAWTSNNAFIHSTMLWQNQNGQLGWRPTLKQWSTWSTHCLNAVCDVQGQGKLLILLHDVQWEQWSTLLCIRRSQVIIRVCCTMCMDRGRHNMAPLNDVNSEKVVQLDWESWRCDPLEEGNLWGFRISPHPQCGKLKGATEVELHVVGSQVGVGCIALRPKHASRSLRCTTTCVCSLETKQTVWPLFDQCITYTGDKCVLLIRFTNSWQWIIIIPSVLLSLGRLMAPGWSHWRDWWCSDHNGFDWHGAKEPRRRLPFSARCAMLRQPVGVEI